uniref:30S ribosomal protein S3 n=1 Tax=uncultured organism TaxID=155900 RepID=U3GW50_9ZZZZ|nr:30S ribosomal protein S3 [uncultured organism]AJS11724.1 ribosomal protein S3-domain protein [uncultured archaeon]
MAVEKKFLKKALSDYNVKKFLFKELDRAGVSSIELQKTPIATRIAITVRRPGVVVGKRGKSIKDLCDALERDFKIENPQIEVIEVQNAALDPKMVAEKIGRRVETKPQFKPAIRIALREIMEAGAMGAEIRAAGKIVGKGGKAKVLTVRQGLLKKSGDSMKLVRVGTYIARMSAGAVGITVRIVPPGTVFHDTKVKKGKAAAIAAAEVAAAAVAEAVATVPPVEIPAAFVAEPVKEETAKPEKKKRVSKKKAETAAVEGAGEGAEDVLDAESGEENADEGK